MGGKTKKKQARKQAATQTKRNGGRNGVSGHMKKSSIGNGKRAAESGDAAAAKKSGKNSNNQKSTNMKRKRDEEEDDEGEEEGGALDDIDNSEVRGSSMFTSKDDHGNGSEEGSASKPKNAPKSSQKKQKHNESVGKAPVISHFRELSSAKLLPLEGTSFSRLLYPNPVCFLTTLSSKKEDGTEGGLNAMTLSWMTPVNNYGGFAFAIHKTRYSAANLLSSKKFTLSVPTAQSRELVLAVGRVSGKVVKKFDGSIANLTAGSFGLLGMAGKGGGGQTDSSSKNKNGFDALFDSDDDEEEEGEGGKEEKGGKGEAATESNKTASSASRVHAFPPPIDGTVAHMECVVLSHTDAADEGTYLVVAKIMRAAVHPEYWKGKCFVTGGEGSVREGREGTGPIGDSVEPVTRCLPPIMSFLGSQRFGHLVSE